MLRPHSHVFSSSEKRSCSWQCRFGRKRYVHSMVFHTHLYNTWYSSISISAILSMRCILMSTMEVSNWVPKSSKLDYFSIETYGDLGIPRRNPAFSCLAKRRAQGTKSWSGFHVILQMAGFHSGVPNKGLFHGKSIYKCPKLMVYNGKMIYKWMINGGTPMT